MIRKKIIITGCSGFIGLNLINQLVYKGYSIFGIDKNINNEIRQLKKDKKIIFSKINLCNEDEMLRYYKLIKGNNFESIWHLAANSDISKGINDYRIELNDTFLTTIHSIELAKKLSINSFIFASSSAIYGSINKKISEESAPMRPISNYGSMKLASERFIYASSKHFKKIFIFRFPNVIGPNMTHGLLFDLKNKFELNSKRIQLLGDGNQKKPYLHVHKLLEYMLKIYRLTNLKNINVYNIGPNDSGITVKEIANLFNKYLNHNKTKFIYEKKKYGWVGDVTKYSYNNNLVTKVLKTTIPSSKDNIIKAIQDIKKK